jgi:hypothetical protein
MDLAGLTFIACLGFAGWHAGGVLAGLVGERPVLGNFVLFLAGIALAIVSKAVLS